MISGTRIMLRSPSENGYAKSFHSSNHVECSDAEKGDRQRDKNVSLITFRMRKNSIGPY